MVISTKGRNMPDVCHFKSLAPTTECVETQTHTEEEDDIIRRGHYMSCIFIVMLCYELKQTFDGHFALPVPRMSVQLDLDGHLTYRLVHA